MRILILNLLGVPFDEQCLERTGVGGSETWSVQLADAFARKGHEVTVLCNTTTHFALNGVFYLPTQNTDFVSMLRNRKYDLCIISRYYSNVIEVIDALKACDNVFIQAHDVEITGTTFETIKQLPSFKGIATLSAYQERSLHEKNNVDWDYMFRVENGIDPTLFEGLDFTPRNKRILHSSCYYRGGNITKDLIGPLYKQKVPEGGVDFCSYTDMPQFSEGEDAKIIGSFNKKDLYKQMSERYCWFYPCNITETFCITMIENVMCENDLILPLRYGPLSVLEPYNNDISMKHDFESGDNEFTLAVAEATNRIINSVTNHEKGEELRKELKNYVLSNYTWDKIADKWLRLIK